MPTTTAQPSANTGMITGRVTDEATGEPVSNTYITVGWQDSQLAAITDADGRYTVPNVPAGEPAPVFGFHANGYRYHNSAFDDDLNIMLEPGETYTYDFSLVMLDPEGQPEVSDPSISSETAAPGGTVTLGLTARDGEGGLSREVFAANPKFGRLVLLKPAGGDRFRAEFTIPADTPPGEYTFAFFTASNKCYVNGEFPRLTLRVT
ncbi:MAG: carboxypeptidase regulatory-like domain-containing protein [Rubrobacter sp.]|nr:carboxypeptidase regulatory-like domain-containing protein [Rubrobacter sp.]MBA4115813.1 carboxypeptidase regulatory-like domain-containing protein [Rubrobacter sp.]